MQLLRDDQNDRRTFGAWINDAGVRECETLEPPATHTFPNRRRIPAGKFTCRLRYSPSHGYAVFGYVGVPGFSDVEIHPGNDVYDTEACTLLGSSRGELVIAGATVDAVLNSRNTFDAFMTARGVPNYKALTNWDLVRDFTVAHPDVAEFTVTVVDPTP